MSTGQNCTKELNCTQNRMKGQFCTKILLHEYKFAQGAKLHRDNFEPRVNVAQIAFLHESKTKNKKKT